MKNYIITLQHDNGTIKIQTNGSNGLEAMHKVIQAEGCPVSAVINIKPI